MANKPIGLLLFEDKQRKPHKWLQKYHLTDLHTTKQPAAVLSVSGTSMATIMLVQFHLFTHHNLMHATQGSTALFHQ